MKCENCGNPLTGKENFCRICGTPVNKDNNQEIDNENIELTGNIDVTKIVVDNKEKPKLELDLKDSEKKEEQTDKNESIQEETDKEFLLIEDNSSEKKIKSILEEFDQEDEKTKELELNEKLVNDSAKEKKDNKKNKKDNFSIDTKDTEQKEKKSTEQNVQESTEENDKLEEQHIKLELDDEVEEKNTKKAKHEEEIEVNNESVANIISQQERNHELIENQKNNNQQQNNSIENQTENNEKKLSKSTEEKNNSETKETNTNPSVIETPISQEIIVEQEEKRHGLVLPIILTFIIILLLIVSIILLLNNSQLKNNNKKLSNSNKDLEEKLVEEKNKNKMKQKSTVTYKGYEITLEDNDSVVIDDNMAKYNDFSFEIANDTKFDDLKNDVENLKSIITSNGYTVNNYGKKVFDNKEFLFFDTNNNENVKYLIIYTSIDENDSIALVISDSSEESKLDNLDNYFQFILSLKKKENHNIIENNLFK